MFTKQFWLATAERAIRGGALVASGTWGVATITDVTVLGSAVQTAAVGFAWGAIGSALLSLIGSQVSVKGSPSFTGAETVDQAPVGQHQATDQPAPEASPLADATEEQLG
jgi:hypothetical protein